MDSMFGPRRSGPTLDMHVAQAKSSLSSINTGAEKFELELSFKFAVPGWSTRLNALSTLSNTREHLAIRRKLIFEGRQLNRSHDVEPIRIVLFELIPEVEHGETINFESALTFCVLRFWHRLLFLGETLRDLRESLANNLHSLFLAWGFLTPPPLS